MQSQIAIGAVIMHGRAILGSPSPISAPTHWEPKATAGFILIASCVNSNRIKFNFTIKCKDAMRLA